MAITVPRVDGPTVQQQGLTNARYTYNADAGPALAVASGLRQLGGAVAQIAEREQQKADDAAIMEAREQLAIWEREQFDPENPQGVMSRRGKDALGLGDAVSTSFEQRRAQIEQGLRNDRQRQAFRQVSFQFGGQVRERVDRISQQEYGRYLEATEEATLATLSERAATAGREGRLDAMAQEVALAEAAIDVQAQRLGLGPEVAAARKAAFTSSTVVATTNGMLERGDFAGAAAFYRANAEDMLEQDRARMDGVVRNAELEVKEVSEAQAIMARYGTSSAAIQAAEAISDPMLRDRVVSRIDREAARRKRAQNEADRAARRQAYDAVFSADPGARVEDVVPPNLLVRMDPMERMALEGFQERRLAGTQTRTDPRVYERLATLPPEKLATENLERYYADGALSLAHLQNLQAKQDAILNPDPAKVPRSATEAEIIAQQFRIMGLQPTGKRDEAKRGQFRMAYFDAEREAVAEKGRALTQPEQEQLANQLALRLSRDSTWLGIFPRTEEKRAFEVTPEQRREYTVPAAIRQRILDDARAQGYDALSEQDIREAYVRNAEYYNRLQVDE